MFCPFTWSSQERTVHDIQAVQDTARHFNKSNKLTALLCRKLNIFHPGVVLSQSYEVVLIIITSTLSV